MICMPNTQNADVAISLNVICYFRLQRCVETAIASCLCDSSKLMYPPLLPFVSLYPAEGQKFTYHFHCSNSLLGKYVLPLLEMSIIVVVE